MSRSSTYSGETGMIDEDNMRLRLQNVAAYRELCRSVQRSGRENIVFAMIMFGLACFLYVNGQVGVASLIFYGILIAGEVLVGLFKWLVPTAEGVLLDGLVLLVFAFLNLGIAYLRVQQGAGPSGPAIFFGLYMLFGAINRFRYYSQLRKLFADRPAPEHIAWFDELVHEIRAADPHTDQLVLDLPTRPYWKAKLLGSTVFFVANNGHAVWVVGPDEFTLKREKTERGTGYRKAVLSIHGEAFPEFDIDDVSWSNYAKWMASLPTTQPTT